MKYGPEERIIPDQQRPHARAQPQRLQPAGARAQRADWREQGAITRARWRVEDGVLPRARARAACGLAGDGELGQVYNVLGGARVIG